MATFRILGIESQGDDKFEFTIAIIYQNLDEDQTFLTFDTHHPIEWKIISIISKNKMICLTVAPKMVPEMFIDAIIDMEKKTQRFYEYDVLEEFKDEKWRDVPVAYLSKWRSIFSTNMENIFLSEKCPICGKLGLRTYYHNHKPQQMEIGERKYSGKGTVWNWCSCCRHYEHISAMIPNEWPYENILNEKILCYGPDFLNERINGILT